MKALLVQHATPRVNYAVPLGLAYIGAVLKNNGVQVKAIDLASPYASYSDSDTLKLAKDFSPDFIGLTVTTLFAAFAYDLISDLKELSIPLIAGGPHPTLFPEEVLGQGADIVVRGEGEQTVLELLDYFKGNKGLSDIQGISYLDSADNPVTNPQQNYVGDIDNLPFPDKDIFRRQDYARNKKEMRRYACIISSRGCIGRCTYCSRAVFGNRYRFRSAKNIFSEMLYLNRHYGIRHISFLDDVFTAHRGRIFEFCGLLKEESSFGLRWDCVTRADCVTDEMLKAMRDSGCEAVNYGIESANPATLKAINKGETIEQLEEVIVKTHEAGMEVSVNFMWGYPWENMQDIENTFAFIKKIDSSVKEVMPGGILIPFPGTKLFQDHKDKFGFDGWWLRRDKFTGKYRTDTYIPLYRMFLFDDQGQLEAGGFFAAQKATMKKIEQVTLFLGRGNLLKRHGARLGNLLFLACYVSFLLYKLNPYMERLFSQPVYFLIRMKNSIIKDPVYTAKPQKVSKNAKFPTL